MLLFFYGFISAVFLMGLMTGCFYLGTKNFRKEIIKEELTEEEKFKRKEIEESFESMFSYNSKKAFGGE